MVALDNLSLVLASVVLPSIVIVVWYLQYLLGLFYHGTCYDVRLWWPKGGRHGKERSKSCGLRTRARHAL